MTDRFPRRRILASVTIIAVLGMGGCLTLNPTVAADVDSSPVFEAISTNEPWSSGRVRTTVRLDATATTTKGVTKLTVISERGTSFDSAMLDSGQTKATVFLPTNQNATIVAVDTVDGTVVETQSVTTDGNKLV